MFYKGLVISFFEHQFGDEDIGTVFWNNGTKSKIKDQSEMQWDNPVHSGIVYMSWDQFWKFMIFVLKSFDVNLRMFFFVLRQRLKIHTR